MGDPRSPGHQPLKRAGSFSRRDTTHEYRLHQAREKKPQKIPAHITAHILPQSHQSPSCAHILPYDLYVLVSGGSASRTNERANEDMLDSTHTVRRPMS